jgi:Spy/CpxP family protein refolding chaperone
MKKRLIVITLTVAALAAIPLFIYAGPGMRAMHGGMHAHGAAFGHGGLGFFGHLQKLKTELGLSDAQVEQLKAIAKETHEQNAGFHDQLHGTLKGVATTLLTNPNDIAGAQAVVDRQAEAERQLKSNLIAAASKALNVLTPEQRTKLALYLAERGRQWENHGR